MLEKEGTSQVRLPKFLVLQRRMLRLQRCRNFSKVYGLPMSQPTLLPSLLTPLIVPKLPFNSI